jgi:hypothetical protein
LTFLDQNSFADLREAVFCAVDGQAYFGVISVSKYQQLKSKFIGAGVKSVLPLTVIEFEQQGISLTYYLSLA